MEVQEKKEETFLENEEEKSQEIQSIEEKIPEESIKEKNDETIEITDCEDTVENDTENKKQPKTIKMHPILLAFIILIILTCVGFISYKIYRYYNPITVPITNISISLTEEIIDINTPTKIETIIEPANYTSTSLQWISSNPEVINVESGIITALTEGESTIYAINDNGIKSNEIIVYSTIKMKEITLSKELLEINVNSSETLLATFIPEHPSNKQLIWSSSDSNIATVDENGVVTGKNVGECIISVSNHDNTITSSCNITIKPIDITSLYLDETQVTLGVGQEYLLVGGVSPSNATYRNFTWSSSDNSILTVDNGKIKAISEGSAVITITSKNGKTATCNFTVKSNISSGTIRYAKNTYSVRTGPSNNYYKLTSVYKNDEIEILKISNSWTKVRTHSGIVGYMLSSGYSSTKSYYISNIPYINQFSLGYPTGCEAVSAAMAANYAGYNVSSAQIIAATPTDEKGIRQETKTIEITVEQVNEETGEIELIIKTEEQTDWYGGNPFEVFVGHPSKQLNQGSYGCYAKPITIALQSCGVPATNISGCSIDTVFEYIRNGKPVVVWCKKNAGDLIEGVTWKYEDGSGSYTELKGEHCAVLIGYDGEYVYLNDPSAGKGVKQPKAKFISNWHILFNQAIVIN